MNRPAPERMSTNVRLIAYITFAVLWLSGCLWMILAYFFPTRTEFGLAPHPWQPAILHFHGWIAVLAVFLLGWLGSMHITERWRQPRNRASGLTLITLAAVLTITGYALYYTTEQLHSIAAAIHEIVGAAVVVFALSHWWRRPGGQGDR
jgi:NADH:ubiquinone oxidoreductase subunit 6 (subunit J)